MKNFLFALVVAGLAFAPAADTISKKERDSAAKLLKDTEDGVFKQVKGLSDAQLKWKPAADRWSVEECAKHIAISEQNLWQMVSGIIKATANPEKRGDVKSTDEQVVAMIENRTQKVKTMDAFKPENTPYKSLEEALASFKSNREKLIEYVNSTQEDLRNHITQMPFGMLDSYQMILFIGAHSNRHTQQMAEVMADPNFPKN
jgi:uncharacterized damage-inducible protein DinB